MIANSLKRLFECIVFKKYGRTCPFIESTLEGAACIERVDMIGGTKIVGINQKYEWEKIKNIILFI